MASDGPEKLAMSDEAVVAIANYFKLLSDPLRLRLLQTLMQGEHTVGQLVQKLYCSQANVSKHLRLLLEGDLVARRRDGLNACYRIADPVLETICGAVCNRQAGRLSAKAAAFAALASDAAS